MRVASLENLLVLATLVSAIVVVLWGIKIYCGVWATAARVQTNSCPNKRASGFGYGGSRAKQKQIKQSFLAGMAP